ncbi:hypothetical protein NA57DRAFT_51651 [Rhizodiscina lignyota]|uniref:tRNA/rRNA methyltransferase SpoU type domain-containing protein n=1 Tax=Rhizodiscina lignyota TaxID=1504668 RepID=A0A9P4IS58_9PEZI|nr:hypothetical protein NA57DRAFT_51651 [Rhizodiscina lignyota]
MPQTSNNETNDVEGLVEKLSSQALVDGHVNSASATFKSAWQQIQGSVNDNPSQQNAPAFAAWVKWLHQFSNSSDAGDIFRDDKYWKLVQQGLRANSAEQRKYCLYILSRSLALLDQDVNTPRMAFAAGNGQREYFLDAYGKYCILFQTLVLDRYINQVEECLPELKELATPYGAVDPSWIIILLDAALRSGIQDSVRKAVGINFLDWDLMTYPATDVWSEFLVQSFLPWACQGSLFTSSIMRNGAHVICEHGDKLSSFIDRLVCLCEDEDALLLLCRQILDYIVDTGAKQFSFSGPYLLEGLLKGLGSVIDDAPISLGPQERELVRKIVSIPGLPPIARALQEAQCLKLCALTRTDEIKDPNSALEPLRQDISSDSSNFQASLETDVSSIHDLMETVEATGHRSLHGPGLVKALKRITKSFNVETGLPAETIFEALTTIWEAIVTQDYPRPVLLVAPGAFFHPQCISASSDHPELNSFLLRVLSELQGLCNGRVYVLASLTKALRYSYGVSFAILQEIQISNFIVSFADKPPVPKPEFFMEAAVSSILERDRPNHAYMYYYGHREGVGYANLFDMVNRLRADDWVYGRQVLDRLLEPWEQQTLPVPMVSKWKTTPQLQLMVILCHRCFVHRSPDVAHYFKRFLTVLSMEPLPRFRYLLEWISLSLLEKDGISREEVLTPLCSPNHDNPKFMAALLKIVVQACILDECPEDFGLRIMTAMVALCASPKIVVRHEAQWSFLGLWDVAERKCWQSLTGNIAFRALNDYIRTLDRYTNPPPQRALEKFDIRHDRTLTNLFEGHYLRIEPWEDAIVRREDFEIVWKQEQERFSLPGDAIPLGDPKPTVNVSSPLSTTEAETSTEATSTAGPLQTKSSAWQNILNLSDTSLSTSQRVVRPITVFASHIAFAHNLGGISRAAEIFGAEALIVGKAEVVKDRAFLGVSVNSHMHLPIEEVKSDEKIVREWLQSKRGLGYGIVGVEQTDKSIVLGRERPSGRGDARANGSEGSKVLPKKCVLVLGSEKEGIPGWLLAECDLCVEIPQVGVTRSLNVQTAAAVVLYEYGREWG